MFMPDPQANNGATGVFGTANKTISALTGTPVLLVMVLLNMSFLAVAAYYLRNQQDNAFKLVGNIFDHCLPGHVDKP
jgi:hypothetical protein